MMFKVKKCANCGGNSFKLLCDTNVTVACEACGQTYPMLSIKRLPDDMEASRQLKVSVTPMTKDLIHVP
jgi:uncharacterized Zn finger protein